MSYTKKTWTAGQKVKSADLNNMEGGIDAAANPFVVTLTPTAEDFSGTMDKTVAEINAAYEAGRKIVFHVLVSLGGDYLNVDCTMAYKYSSHTYPVISAFIINVEQNILMYAFCGGTDDGTDTTYFTSIYPLTPMT